MLDSPLELLDSLLFVLSPMLEAVLRKAMDYAYALRSVRLTLDLEGAEPHTVAVRPATPTQNREVLLKLLNLELQAHPPESGILRVRLDAEPAQPQTAQHGLFQAKFPEPDRLELLLARLRSIAGEDNVGSPQLQNSHGEDAFTLAPFQPSLRTGTGRACVVTACPPGTPSAATGAGGLLEQSTPDHVLAGGGLPITSAAGPWHTSGSCGTERRGATTSGMW